MSRANKLRLIKLPREAGMSDVEILRKSWAANMGAKEDGNWWLNGECYLGLGSSEALRLAHASGLIPSAAPAPRRVI